MKYENPIFLYPPRAENAIPPGLLDSYERRGYIAQIKKNGTNSVIFVSPEKKIHTLGRHNTTHKQWDFLPEAKAIFEALPGKGWYVINAELLHSKVVGLRHINYIHDILVEDGEYLIGTTYAQRYARLLMLFLKGNETSTESHFVLDDYTWLAKNHREGFKQLYNSLEKPEDEGLVLKNPEGKLATRNNSGWTVKCRRPHKNFGF